MTKIVSMPKKTEGEFINLNAFKALDLLRTLRAIQNGNKSLPETAARWIVKNCKKLNRVIELHQPKENAISNAYGLHKEVNGKLRLVFWDGYEIPIIQGDQIVFGKRAVLIDDLLFEIDIDFEGKIYGGGTQIPMERMQMYAPYVPQLNRQEYLEKKRTLSAGEYSIKVEKIDSKLLSGVTIPSPPPNMQGYEYDILDLLYESLVQGDVDSEDDVVDLYPLTEQDLPIANTDQYLVGEDNEEPIIQEVESKSSLVENVTKDGK